MLHGFAAGIAQAIHQQQQQQQGTGVAAGGGGGVALDIAPAAPIATAAAALMDLSALSPVRGPLQLPAILHQVRR